MAEEERLGRLGKFRRQRWSELDEYDRASIAVDCVLLTVDQAQLQVLVHRRTADPHSAQWALPGVFVSWPERDADAVVRALKEKAGLDALVRLQRLDWSGEPERDERGWVVTHAYLGVVDASTLRRSLAPDRHDVALAPVFLPRAASSPTPDAHVPLSDSTATRLAFDHNRLIAEAVVRLRGQVRYTGVAVDLVGEEFTLRELEDVYEAVLGERPSRATFQRLVIKELALVEPTGRWEPPGVGRRRAQLYRRRSS